MMVRRASWSLLLAFLFAFVLTPPATHGQKLATMEPEVAQAFDFPLTIRSIMRGPELVGEGPQRVIWTDDSQWIYFRWRPGGGEWHESSDLYRVRAGGGEPEKLSQEAADSLAILFAGGGISPDRRYRVSAMDGDLFLVERREMEVRRLTETRSAEGSPSFRDDGKAVFFSQESNLFEILLDSGSIRQLTDIRSGSPPRDPREAEGQKAFLEKQQRELFEHIRLEKSLEEEREEARERAGEGEPKPLFIPNGERVRGLSPNPAGSHVIVSTYQPAEGARGTMVPDWVTASGYTEELNVRSKVGDAQGLSRVALLEVASGEVSWLELWPEGEEEVEEDVETPNPELASGEFLGWNDAGTHALFMSVNYDFDTRWIFTLDIATGELTLVDTYFDEAWAEGACFRCAGWIPDSEVVYFSSEESGYAHLHSVNADGTDRKALTSGEWEVLDVEVGPEREGFLLHTSEGSPFNRHVYSMAFDGSRRRALTAGDGGYTATPSPNGERMAVVFSSANRPPELFLADLEPGAEMERVTTSPTQEWLSFPWIQPEIVRFSAQDGARVPARIYRPADVGASPNGAAVIFVHGAGYLHNVHNYWSSYFREYMFHHFLAANGYTVLDIDYRGSAGYGRDWRTSIYRRMGGKDLSDQVDGAAYLVASEDIDPHRIGLYGGSYGGFITLMALFTAPDVFEAGAALRSVTDWAHYNHWYTGRILNPPHEDPEAYEKSSPIYFAEGLEGHLLIAHGMVDTNVHFSDVVRLAQRLIELGKENWEMAVYPVESHGFREPTSWTDEYRRIFQLFERTIGKK